LKQRFARVISVCMVIKYLDDVTYVIYGEF